MKITNQELSELASSQVSSGQKAFYDMLHFSPLKVQRFGCDSNTVLVKIRVLPPGLYTRWVIHESFDNKANYHQ